jgi:hypothetical protein
MSNQVVSTGIPVSPTTGSAQLVRNGGGQLLGFFVTTGTPTVAIYDANSTSNLPTAKLSYTAAAVGWVPFPMEFVNGLVVNVSAAVVFIVQ